MAYKNPEDKRKNQALYRARNREKLKQYASSFRLSCKEKVLNHYGKSCARCNFDDFRALQIDHINDDGATERMAVGGYKSFSGYQFYRWLIAEGFPEGYQTLCANCNVIKQWDLTHTGK